MSGIPPLQLPPRHCRSRSHHAPCFIFGRHVYRSGSWKGDSSQNWSSGHAASLPHRRQPPRRHTPLAHKSSLRHSEPSAAAGLQLQVASGPKESQKWVV